LAYKNRSIVKGKLASIQAISPLLTGQIRAGTIIQHPLVTHSTFRSTDGAGPACLQITPSSVHDPKSKTLKPQAKPKVSPFYISEKAGAGPNLQTHGSIGEKSVEED